MYILPRVPDPSPTIFSAAPDDAGQRLDQFLASRLDVSRARVQLLISQEKVLVNDAPAKASLKLRSGEHISVIGEAERPPLRAIAEEIPLDIVYEDDDMAIINKAAGMMVHAGAGATGPNGEDQRNRGTLVNALLHHFATLSGVGGEMRPGIVHRLDKETSGLIVVAKNDEAHRKLAEQFARREVKKTYIALVHGWPKKDRGTISAAISRDRVRRIRMTTRGTGGRDAVSHYTVLRRLDTAFGKFSLIEVKIDTGRTHQIRVHMASLGILWWAMCSTGRRAKCAPGVDARPMKAAPSLCREIFSIPHDWNYSIRVPGKRSPLKARSRPSCRPFWRR